MKSEHNTFPHDWAQRLRDGVDGTTVHLPPTCSQEHVRLMEALGVKVILDPAMPRCCPECHPQRTLS